MSRCLNGCGKETLPGFSTCSQECAASYSQGSPQPTVKMWPHGPGTLSAKELAEKIGYSTGVIYSLVKESRIPCDKSLGTRRWLFNLEEVRNALGIPQEPAPKVEEGACMDMVVSNAVEFDNIRDRAIKAAREAYRDEILSSADGARSIHNAALEVKLLREFVRSEEQFKVVFERN